MPEIVPMARCDLTAEREAGAIPANSTIIIWAVWRSMAPSRRAEVGLVYRPRRLSVSTLPI